jgi:hypothetical protein
VKVALDATPSGVTGFDDAQARDSQLLEASTQVGLKALVVDRQ